MKNSLSFLSKLSKNNNKPWFDENKKEYDAAKKEFIAVVDKLIKNVTKFDPEMAGLEASKTIFRINRDIRFSKDKTPYKNNFGASINPGGKNSFTSGYYLHVEAGGKSFLAGGCYMPQPDQLSAIRQEIDYHPAEFKKILSNKDFVSYFKKLDEEDKLKTAPKGYEKDNPNIELLKHKHFIVVHNLTDKQVTSPDFTEYCAKVYKAMLPLNKFLRKAK
ncbi:MAG: DUF2461 domain-containing protein, partial [Bacteroidia bacterium]